MKILSIDPGYERLGIAIIEKIKGGKETVLFSECFKTSKDLPFEDRLCLIGARVEECIMKFVPSGLAIENLFLSNNKTTAMRVAEVRGALIYLARRHGLFIKEYNPMQIKLAVTGDGRSGKDQVTKMVRMLVKNVNPKAIDDEYDAIAIGLAFYAHERI